MQTKPFADLTVNASTPRDEARVSPSGPIELDLSVLQFVTGGLAPRGGWASTESIVIDPTDAPRGGWQ